MLSFFFCCPTGVALILTVWLHLVMEATPCLMVPKAVDFYSNISQIWNPKIYRRSSRKPSISTLLVLLPLLINSKFQTCEYERPKASYMVRLRNKSNSLTIVHETSWIFSIPQCFLPWKKIAPVQPDWIRATFPSSPKLDGCYPLELPTSLLEAAKVGQVYIGSFWCRPMTNSVPDFWKLYCFGFSLATRRKSKSRRWVLYFWKCIGSRVA